VFKDSVIVGFACDQLLRAGEEHRFAVLAYCFMPDHVHVLAEGQAPTSDLLRFVRAWKQRAAVRVRSAKGVELWQEGFYDHVLRHEEDSLAVAA